MTEQRINIMDDNQPVISTKQTQEKESEVIYASVTERFVALLIDYGIIFLPFQFGFGLWFKWADPELSLPAYFGLVALVNLVFVLYEAFFSCGDRVTVGKSLVGIAVVKKDLSGPISFGRAFVRAIGYYISGAILMCGFLLAFFDDKHRALHDVLGGSVVVQIRPKSGLERLIVRTLGSVLLVSFVWTIYVQVFGAGSLIDQYYIRHARIQLRRVALLEDGHKRLYGAYTNDLLRLSLLSGDPVHFQRDMQENLEPKGFKIGITKDGYKISAVAKDKKHTRVVVTAAE